MRETPASFAASEKIVAASRSRSWKSGWSSIECTRYHAASTSSSARRMSSADATSPSATSTRSTHGLSSIEARRRVSTRTAQPSSSSRGTTWPPTYPEAPVTRARRGVPSVVVEFGSGFMRSPGQLEGGWEEQEHPGRPHDVRDDRPEEAAGDAALQGGHETDDGSRQDEQRDAAADGGQGVEQGRQGHLVAREGGVEGAAEVELLDDAVDEGDGEHRREGPEPSVVEQLVDRLAQHGDAGDDERTDEEEGEEQHAEHEGLHDRPGLLAATRVPHARVQGARQQRADEPHRRQGERRDVEERVARGDPQRPGQHRGAHDEGERDDDERTQLGHGAPHLVS